MRSLALLPAQKIFAPLRLYRQRYIYVSKTPLSAVGN
jgi:hypothetical protein